MAGEPRERRRGWYRWRGYRIVDRNWRCPEGEIDLVAVRRRAGLVVFVEVKARTTERFGTAAEAVGDEKQQRLRALALRYLEDATVPPALDPLRRRGVGRRTPLGYPSGLLVDS